MRFSTSRVIPLVAIALVSLGLLSRSALAVRTQTSTPGTEVYFACYLQKSKVGWQSVKSTTESRNGKSFDRSESHTELSIGLIGSALKVKMDSVVLSDAGRPTNMTFHNESAGRYQDVSALFGEKTVTVAVDNNGTKTTQTLAIPTGGTIVDDPISEVAAGRLKAGQTTNYWILDPTTISFIKNIVRNQGVHKIELADKQVDATVIEIEDPRASTNVFLDAKGEILKISSALGIEMLPVTKEVALAPAEKTSPAGEPENKPDLAELTSIKPSIPLPNPETITQLKLRLKTKDLSTIPSDAYPSVKKDGDGWLIFIHPYNLNNLKPIAIKLAKTQQPEWTKPGLHIPSTAPKFVKLAKQIVGTSTDVKSAGLKIRRYVNKVMTPNAGIGVLRDATEILSAKEGVCRDYAILTATLCRAAGIPTRLVSGLVSFDGNFYYHAWVEVWVGSRWIGLDSVSHNDQISATHIKLAQGTVQTAFTFSVLSGAKMQIVSVKR